MSGVGVLSCGLWLLVGALSVQMVLFKLYVYNYAHGFFVVVFFVLGGVCVCFIW